MRYRPLFLLLAFVTIFFVGCQKKPPEAVKTSDSSRSSERTGASSFSSVGKLGQPKPDDAVHRLVFTSDTDAERADLQFVLHQGLTDILLKDTHRSKLLISDLSDVYTAHFQAASYHRKHLFVLKRIVSPDQKDWADELWKYGTAGGSRLFSGRDISFAVAADIPFVAVNNGDGSMLVLNDADGKIFLQYLPGDISPDLVRQNEEIKNSSVKAMSWSRDGTKLWGYLGFLNPVLFFRIDSRSWDVTTYNLPREFGSEWALNPESGLLAYSTFPWQKDFEAARQLELKKTEIKLYVFNFQTGETIQIAKSKAKKFFPEWTSPETLSYRSSSGMKNKIFESAP